MVDKRALAEHILEHLDLHATMRQFGLSRGRVCDIGIYAIWHIADEPDHPLHARAVRFRDLSSQYRVGMITALGIMGSDK